VDLSQHVSLSLILSPTLFEHLILFFRGYEGGRSFSLSPLAHFEGIVKNADRPKYILLPLY